MGILMRAAAILRPSGIGPTSSPTRTGPPLRDPARRFSADDLERLKQRAGQQCECPGCRHHDGRCLALFDAPGVQAQGDHLVSWDEGGATDWVLNGAALCAPCNNAKSNVEYSVEQLARIAANRRAVL